MIIALNPLVVMVALYYMTDQQTQQLERELADVGDEAEYVNRVTTFLLREVGLEKLRRQTTPQAIADALRGVPQYILDPEAPLS